MRHVTEELIQSTSKYQIEILTDDENYHSTQYIKRFVWYSLVLIPNPSKNRSPKALNLAQNGNFSIFSLFRPLFFVTIATVKV